MGQVLSPHGIGGMVKVFPYSDFPERVNMLSEIELANETERRHLTVEEASLYGRFWLVKFRGIDTREDAARLNGSLILIPLRDRMPLPEDSFYHDQLVGLQVYNISGELLGSISAVISTGGHDLYVLELAGQNKKSLIPAVKKFIKQVDLAANRVIVELPEGLLDL